MKCGPMQGQVSQHVAQECCVVWEDGVMHMIELTGREVRPHQGRVRSQGSCTCLQQPESQLPRLRRARHDDCSYQRGVLASDNASHTLKFLRPPAAA